MSTKATPRRVDYSRRDDHDCAFLGALGFSTKFIVARTRLTGGQIGYRLKKASIRRMDYRDGGNAFARIVISSASTLAERQLIQHLKRHL